MRWKLLKEFVGLVVFAGGAVLLAVHGAKGLLLWYSTGQHWASFGGKSGGPRRHELITFADDPANLVGLLLVDAIYVGASCIVCVVLIRSFRSIVNSSRDGSSSL